MWRPLPLPSAPAPLPVRAGRRIVAGARRRAWAAFCLDHGREHVQLIRVGVLGAVVLARDRPQHVLPPPCAPGRERLQLLGDLEVDQSQTSQRPLHHPGRAQVAVPALDGVFLGVAVAAEQLHAVRPDRIACSAHERARERRLADELAARLGEAGGAVGRQSHRLELDRDVGDHERDRLAVGDRLAERDPLVDVGARRSRARPARCRPRARTSRAGRARRAHGKPQGQSRRAARRREPRRRRASSRPVAAARRPIAGSGVSSARACRTRRGTATGRSVELGRDDEQLGLGCAGDERLDPVEHVTRRRCAARGSAGRTGRPARAARRSQSPRRAARRRRTRADTPPAGRRRPTVRARLRPRPAPGRRGRSPCRPRPAPRRQRGGDGRALLDHAAELLGHAERVRPSSAAVREQLGRGRAGGVGGGGGGRSCSSANSRTVSEQLLLLGRRDVEQAPAPVLAWRAGRAGWRRRGMCASRWPRL